MRGVDGHVTVLAGAQDQVVHVRSVTSPPVDNHSWNPHAALALGANLRLGPGRALAQVQFDSGATGVAGLTGSVGSVQLQLGYLVTVY